MEMMIRGRALALRFCLNSLAVGIVTLALLYLVDSYFYGKTVIVSGLSLRCGAES